MAKGHKPRIDGVQIIALFLEAVFNGVFWVLLYQTGDVLLQRARSRGESLFKPMTITALFLMTTITGHLFVDLSTAYEAFVPEQTDYCVTGGVHPSWKVYSNVADPRAVINSVFFVLGTVCGDVFMAYRLYIVWGRNKWIVIPPAILSTALLVAGTMVTYLFAVSKTQPSIFAAGGPWITSCFILTFCSNIYSTLLIAARIALSNRQLNRVGSDASLSKIRNILIESASIYAMVIIFTVSCYIAKSNLQFIGVALMNPISGIIFCHIVIRAHHHGTASTSHHSRSNGSSHMMRPVAVKISQMTESQVYHQKASDYGTSVTPPAVPRYPNESTDEGSTGKTETV